MWLGRVGHNLQTLRHTPSSRLQTHIQEERSALTRTFFSLPGSRIADPSTAHTKDDSSGTSIKADKTDIKIGAINSMKKEGADFFYGISYEMGTTKVGTVKTDSSRLPVLIGIEADAASWLTLRGSVKQNVLVGSDKTTETDSAPHDTTVAAGAGFKFNKAVLDVTLTAAGTGSLTSNLGGNAGLTYLF